MSDIDWSKAPEGATHFDPDCLSIPWEKREGDKWFYWDGDDCSWEAMGSDGDYHTKNYPQLIARNNWSGEGLPPVGTVCEYVCGGVRRTVEIIAHWRAPQIL